MTTLHTLEDYDWVQEDSTGDLLLRDANDNEVMRWDVSAGGWTFPAVSTVELQHSLDGATDISGSRSVNTTYQNTAGHVLFVTVELTNSTGSSAQIDANLRVSPDSSISDNDFVDRARLTINDGDLINLSFPVPDSFYYEIGSFGNESINAWFERGYN